MGGGKVPVFKSEVNYCVTMTLRQRWHERQEAGYQSLGPGPHSSLFSFFITVWGRRGRDKRATRSSGYSKMKLLTNVHYRLSPEVRHLEPCTSTGCETLSVDFPMLLSRAISALVEVQSVGRDPVYLHTSAD